MEVGEILNNQNSVTEKDLVNRSLETFLRAKRRRQIGGQGIQADHLDFLVHQVLCSFFRKIRMRIVLRSAELRAPPCIKENDVTRFNGRSRGLYVFLCDGFCLVLGHIQNDSFTDHLRERNFVDAFSTRNHMKGSVHMGTDVRERDDLLDMGCSAGQSSNGGRGHERHSRHTLVKRLSQIVDFLPHGQCAPAFLARQSFDLSGRNKILQLDPLQCVSRRLSNVGKRLSDGLCAINNKSPDS